MENVDLASVAAVLADPSRAAMCLALLDGRAWTVGELARVAGIAPSSASEQVARLRAARFVETLRQGRHQYVRIGDPAVADLVERLTQHAEGRPARGLRASLRANRLAFARHCYDHVAGRLGVALRDGMLHNGLIDIGNGLSVTPSGRAVLADLGVPIPDRPRRPLLRDCLDWTERREHLAGALPAALMRHALDVGWLQRGEGRALRTTDAATEPFSRLGVTLADLTTADTHPTYLRAV
ncbi:DNA-binding transcriptional regulator, ArsR family [Streptoalloteichus tenebrarius]|uniref:DNA-binding transcriptional regulator, ArsR family n=1 Tax=Streptoalloteichus tenebrarius (strain ATCC 17920 / DSM 40477 / JCM 4838 / CBS 697.72 / NBRC 16177 / NCIMB 11028 / NRRL B-12390 / A12253. 1 / ISP 5477) TaxID=1933 RepID=A0ABT1HTN3_STRSD|nr:helix-turn-helix domain-containing protein [Streptoalloteichus tenebrarius]MCP2258886.1 DNA-binding transcriptional regulator, ArsR family [Streptoalloteichus tenebrarius]BFE99429.1 metalloregulator ArsR/SmtB family transcription factor [Streptoalloteichus tenebrarius]